MGYSIALIPVTLAPTLIGMSGKDLFRRRPGHWGWRLLYVGLRLARWKRPITAAVSKQRARQLLQATVFYLPLLFIVMMLDTISS